LRRIAELFDEVILQHDIRDGRKAIYKAWGKWNAGAEPPSRNMFFIVQQPAKRAREIHFGSRLNGGKFAIATYQIAGRPTTRTGALHGVAPRTSEPVARLQFELTIGTAAPQASGPSAVFDARNSHRWMAQSGA
jgi:hypothetical protein